LLRLQKFYERLSLASSSIRTPELIELAVVDGTLISKERFLPGAPLQDHLTGNARHIDKHALAAIIEVLKFLRSIPPFEEGKLLSVLNEATPFWFNATTWSESVQALISRRIKKFGDQLQSEIPDLATMIESINAFLNRRNSVQMGVIHGDIYGANIMVDSKRCPLSVLDFGFFSTIGDLAFDASITSAVFDMYGMHAREIDKLITEALSTALGYSYEVLLAYKAVYAIITSNAYAEDGSDGHYRWCVDILQRQDVRSSLGL